MRNFTQILPKPFFVSLYLDVHVFEYGNLTLV